MTVGEDDACDRQLSHFAELLHHCSRVIGKHPGIHNHDAIGSDNHRDVRRAVAGGTIHRLGNPCDGGEKILRSLLEQLRRDRLLGAGGETKGKKGNGDREKFHDGIRMARGAIDTTFFGGGDIDERFRGGEGGAGRGVQAGGAFSGDALVDELVRLE